MPDAGRVAYVDAREGALAEGDTAGAELVAEVLVERERSTTHSLAATSVQNSQPHVLFRHGVNTAPT
jgi:hypothetical protein